MAIRYQWHEGGMNMSLEGDWVAHADYSAERADTQAEIARLRGALESASNYIDNLGGVSKTFRSYLNQ